MKKYLFIIILFCLTAVASLFIMFYNPYKKYLGVYIDSITIKYNYNIEGYKWTYDLDNEIIKLNKSLNNEWNFVPVSDGKTSLTFYYKNNGAAKYTIVYEFKVKGNKIYWLSGNAVGLLDYPNPY